MVHPATFSHSIRVNLGHSCSPAHTAVDQPVRAHKPFVPSFLRYLAIMSSEPAVKFLLGIPDEGAINFVVRISNVFCRRGPHYDLLLIIGPAPVGQWQGTQLIPRRIKAVVVPLRIRVLLKKIPFGVKDAHGIPHYERQPIRTTVIFPSNLVLW